MKDKKERSSENRLNSNYKKAALNEIEIIEGKLGRKLSESEREEVYRDYLKKQILNNVKKILSPAREIAKKKIKKEGSKGHKLTKAEKSQIFRKYAKRQAAILLMTGSLIAAFGIGTYENNRLVAGGEPSIKIENEYNGTGTVEANSEKSKFIKDIKVTNEEMLEDKALYNSCVREIDNLKDSESVLNFAKQLYINEYNEDNGTNFTSKDVNLWETRKYTLHEDTTGNEKSTKYYKTTTDFNGGYQTDPLVIARFKNGIEEAVILKGKDTTPVYSSELDEQELKEPTTMSKVAETVADTLAMMTVKENDADTSFNHFIRNKAIHSFYQYKLNEREQINNNLTVSERNEKMHREHEEH